MKNPDAQLTHVGFMVRDLDAMVAFYSRILGMVLTDRGPYSRTGGEIAFMSRTQLDARADPRDCWSWEIVEEADRVGLRTLTLAPEYGGPGVDTLTATKVITELCRGDLGAVS